MLDFDFEKLPPLVQYAVIAGAFAGGFYMTVRGLLKARKQPNPETQLAAQAAQMAYRLADAELRADLQEVVQTTREALALRIDTIAAEARAAAAAESAEAKRDRHGIYSRMQEMAQTFDASIDGLDERLRGVEHSIRTLEARPSGRR